MKQKQVPNKRHSHHMVYVNNGQWLMISHCDQPDCLYGDQYLFLVLIVLQLLVKPVLRTCWRQVTLRSRVSRVCCVYCRPKAGWLSLDLEQTSHCKSRRCLETRSHARPIRRGQTKQKTAQSLAIFKQKNQILEWHSLHV